MLAAIVFGHIAFATFLVNQAIYLTILASLLYLADVIVHDGAETLLRPERRSARGFSPWSASSATRSPRSP